MASKFEVVLTGVLDKSTTEANIKKQISNIENSLSMKIDTKVSTDSIKSATGGINELGNAAKTSRGHVQTLGDQLGKFAQWQIIGDVIHGAMSATADMVTQVINLDTAMTELSKVSSMSESEMQSFGEAAYDVGEKVARTGIEVINASTEFSKAGYDKQAMQLAEVALTYQNVADGAVSTADATALIVSSMKAFNVTADDSISIIDQINEVKCVPPYTVMCIA